MSGYMHLGYAESLVEFGTPRELPRSGGWVLERQIPGFSYRDAMGCYPLFACQDWSQCAALSKRRKCFTGQCTVWDFASDYRLSHGNTIAVGMIAATRLSQKMYGLPREDGERIERLIASMGLACRIPEDLATEDILSGLQRDKKKDGETINFVMLKKIGVPFVRRAFRSSFQEGIGQ